MSKVACRPANGRTRKVRINTPPKSSPTACKCWGAAAAAAEATRPSARQARRARAPAARAGAAARLQRRTSTTWTTIYRSSLANQKFATYFFPSFPPPIQAFGGRLQRESIGFEKNGFRLAPGSAGLAGMTAIYATNLRNGTLAKTRWGG